MDIFWGPHSCRTKVLVSGLPYLTHACNLSDFLFCHQLENTLCLLKLVILAVGSLGFVIRIYLYLNLGPGINLVCVPSLSPALPSFSFFSFLHCAWNTRNIIELSVWLMRKSFLLGRKITHTYSENYCEFFFFWAEGQDLILKVHPEEKRKYLMELKPRVTLLIKIGTSQKFNIKVIINEILVLKVVFCWLFEPFFLRLVT